jgi:drug/metabolite transporter, DME family
MPSRSSARLQLLAAAVLFSTGGAAIKAADFSGWQIASFRSGVAAIAIWLMTPAARRGWTRRAVVVGLAYAACLTLFVLANRLTTAANTIYLQSTAPLYLLVLSPWLLKEPIRRQDMAVMVAVGAGLLLVFLGVEPPIATAPDPVRWMGAADGEHGSPVAAVVSGNLTAFLVSLPLALPASGHSVGDWAVIGYLGVFQIALAYVFVTTALGAIPAFEASLILLVEPVLNPVWVWLIQGERPGPWVLLGGAMILSTTVVKGLLDSRATRIPVPSELAIPPTK